jgi:glyoxylase-like metal-dependent hydrolase (beta-lactamase superfamily II)
MLFKQITHDDLGCASYLIGDERAGVAAVVDPRFEIDEYLELARYRGVSIEHVLETHNHADHVSGHGRLVAATGARIHVHRLANPAYEHEPFENGWELQLGSLTVRVLHTPGHRPEHTAFLLIDTTRGDDPWAVLSGDSLFVGGVARTDLAVAVARHHGDPAGIGSRPADRRDLCSGGPGGDRRQPAHASRSDARHPRDRRGCPPVGSEWCAPGVERRHAEGCAGVADDHVGLRCLVFSQARVASRPVA